MPLRASAVQFLSLFLSLSQQSNDPCRELERVCNQYYKHKNKCKHKK